MCSFFSVTSDGLGNIKYFNWEQRKQILKGELGYKPDSHTSINDFYGYKGEDEDCRNKYEYNPLSGEFTIDMINGIDDSKEVEAQVRALDFKTICEPLIIKPILNPFKIKNSGAEDRHVEMLKEWINVWGKIEENVYDSVWDSVGGCAGYPVWNLVRGSVGGCVWDYVYGSIRDSVRASIGVSVWGSIWDYVNDSVRESVWGYVSSFFNLEKWKYIDHEPYKNPFQSGIDLWEKGFVPSFDGKVWRLHSGEKAEIVFEISEDELMAE